MKDYVNAKTEVDDVIDKISQCENKIANIVADMVVTAASKGNVSSVSKNIDNLISELPSELQVNILKSAMITAIDSMSSGAGRSKNVESKSRPNTNDIFARRSRF